MSQRYRDFVTNEERESGIWAVCCREGETHAVKGIPRQHSVVGGQVTEEAMFRKSGRAQLIKGFGFLTQSSKSLVPGDQPPYT